MITNNALNVLEKANLLERGSGDWNMCMTKHSEMVESEKATAARMRNLREKEKWKLSSKKLCLIRVTLLPHVRLLLPNVTGTFKIVTQR